MKYAILGIGTKNAIEVRVLRVRVVGAGALGLLFSSALIKINAQVELFTHSREQRELLNLEGILALDPNTEKSSVLAYSQDSINSAALSQEPVDWIFLMVKQGDITPALVKQLVLISTANTRVLCFQNGIGHLELLQQGFSQNLLYAAITTEASLRVSANSFRHTGRGVTWVGQMKAADSNKWDDPEIKLQTMLGKAGFEVYLSKKIISNIWDKLLINAVINPLTAILRIKNGELLKSAYSLELMRALFEEGALVARCADIAISDDLWDQLLRVCERTSENYSSMLKDIMEGRTTEIEWINGALLQRASPYLLTLPSHQTLFRMIKHLESR